ncbi:MAG: hypothetical protein IJC73_04500 [Lentisphaeria bacterium]|nr:hypothetical protein [Lentisphaeria bacterium]
MSELPQNSNNRSAPLSKVKSEAAEKAVKAVVVNKSHKSECFLFSVTSPFTVARFFFFTSVFFKKISFLRTFFYDRARKPRKIRPAAPAVMPVLNTGCLP